MRTKIGNIFVAFVSVVSASVFSACSESDGPANNAEKLLLSRSETEIVLSENEFAQRLMVAISNPDIYSSQTDRPLNYVVSPLSLSMTLSMVANGTAGETRAEILEALGFESADINEVNALNGRFLEKFPLIDRTATLTIANALWADGSIDGMLRPEYTSCLSDFYAASVTNLDDISSAESMNEINSWSDKHTNGMVPRILSEPLSPNSRIALTNALYFKGIWKEKFDKKKTSKKVFKNYDASESLVDMMYKDELSCSAFEDDGYKVAVLQYGNTGFSMFILLPDPGLDPVEVFSTVGKYDLMGLANGYGFMAQLNISLPKFVVETSVDFIPVLKSMGINKMFDGGDFSHMWSSDNSGFGIGLVKQCTKIEVDEDGAKAASTSASGGGLLSPGPIKDMDFVVDRPFVFGITETSTGAILFCGVVNKM